MAKRFLMFLHYYNWRHYKVNSHSHNITKSCHIYHRTLPSIQEDNGIQRYWQDQGLQLHYYSNGTRFPLTSQY